MREYTEMQLKEQAGWASLKPIGQAGNLGWQPDVLLWKLRSSNLSLSHPTVDEADRIAEDGDLPTVAVRHLACTNQRDAVNSKVTATAASSYHVACRAWGWSPRSPLCLFHPCPSSS